MRDETRAPQAERQTRQRQRLISLSHRLAALIREEEKTEYIHTKKFEKKNLSPCDLPAPQLFVTSSSGVGV